MPPKIQISIEAYRSQRVLDSSIARNIATRRKEINMTQIELARLIGRKQPQIARWERSSYGGHTIHSLNVIATALNTTVSDLTRR